mgnify:CR=1 FL=1
MSGNVGTPALRGGGARTARIASYDIEAQLDGTRHTITATQKLIWIGWGGLVLAGIPLILLKGEIDRFNDELAALVEKVRRYGAPTTAVAA